MSVVFPNISESVCLIFGLDIFSSNEHMKVHVPLMLQSFQAALVVE